MSSMLSLVRSENPIQATETEEQFKKRTIVQAYEQFKELKEPTDEQKKEFDGLVGQYVAIHITDAGYFASLGADKFLKTAIYYLSENIVKDFGQMTGIKMLLLERLLAAVSDSHSYDMIFRQERYKYEGTRMKFNGSPDHIKVLAEIRKGKASTDDRILRLAQALGPPQLSVKVTNAFFARNQQVNQGMPPKDLVKNSESNNGEKTES